MNVKNKSLRVLGMVGAILLSIPLVAMLAFAPLYSATASVVTPQALTAAVQNVDYSVILDDSNVLDGMEESESLPSEMMEALITSDFMEEVISTYMQELLTALQGEPTTDSLSKEHILALTEEHMDELLTLANTYIPNAAEATEDEMRTHIRGTMETMSTELLKTLPSGTQVQAMVPGGNTLNLIAFLTGSFIPWVLYSITLVLAALVFVCLLHRYRGLLCLGIDAMIALIPLLSAYSLLREGGYLYTQLVAGDNAAIMAPLVNALSTNMLIATIVVGVLGLGLIAGYTVYVSRQKKKTAGEALPEKAE